MDAYISKAHLSYFYQLIKNVFAAKSALDNKVDKETGKGLSSNDYTTTEKTKLQGIAAGAEQNIIDTIKVDGTALTVANKSVNISLADYAKLTDLSNKVDKVAGKGLSTNDLTDELLTKINNAGDSSFTGNYEDLTNKPNIAQIAMNTLTGSALAADVANLKNTAVTESDVTALIGQQTHIRFEFVNSLPETGQSGVIYFKTSGDTDSSDNNAYEEYIYAYGKYEKIGVQQVDLSGCWSKTELQAATIADIDAIVNGASS